MHERHRTVRVLLGVVLAIMGQACHSPEPPSPAATSLRGTYTFPSCDVAPEGKYGAGPARSLYLRMRDGVRIAVDVVLPEDLPEGRRIPAILIMTRYWRAEEGREPSGPWQPAKLKADGVRFWVSHGFAVVIGDVRGTGASFGVWPHHRSRDETRDFSEIIDWVAGQPWSDGQVAGFGSSYSANTADWMAERNHPALKAVISRFPDYDPYADLYFPGGLPNSYMGRNWGLEVKDMDLNVKRRYDDGPRGVKPVDGGEGARLLAAAIEARRHVPSVWEALSGITYRDDRPQEWGGWSMDDWGIHAQREAVERSGVPIQSWGSWMDAGTANGVLHRFTTLANPQRVFVGAWSHGGDHDASPYQLENAASNPPFQMQLLEDLCFLERHLNGRNTSRGSAERLLVYFTMGEEQWKTTPTWPPRGSEPQRWYFASGGMLTRDAPTAADGADRYAIDFQATTGTRNRWMTNNTGDDVVYADRGTADRRLLAYTSEPLAEDVEITGQPVVALHITSTHTDGAFLVHFEEVAPDGYVRYLTGGQLRALHRRISADEPPYRVLGPYHSFKRKDGSPLAPGETAEITFELMPVSVIVRARHRLRIAVAGADADTFRRIPEKGAPTIMVYRSVTHPSHIALPIKGR